MITNRLSSRQVGRKLSARLKRTVTELYSGTEDETVTQNDFEKVKEAANTLRNYSIYYVDTPGSVEEVYQTISYFQNTIAKGKWLIIMLDHTLLVRGNSGDDERKVISDLQKMFMMVKKIGTTTIIQLTQLNRNIESVDRIKNPSLHYPQRSDIFASDKDTLKDKIVRLKFGELRGTPVMDNPDPSSMNDKLVIEKEQRLIGEESTNNPNTSAEQLKITSNNANCYVTYKE